MERKTSAVSRCGSVFTCETSTPSAASVSRTKRPLCSSPTRVSIATLSPRRLAHTPRVGGRAAEVLGEGVWSSSRPPICSPYRSTAARPMQMRSRAFTWRSAPRPRRPAPARGTSARPACGTAWRSAPRAGSTPWRCARAGESALSVIAIDRHLARVAGLRHLEHLRRVVLERDDDQRVLRADELRRLVDHAAHRVDQVHRQLELGQRIGEVVGDREGAAVAEDVDGLRAGELAHRGGEVGVRDVLVHRLERGDAVGDELAEHAARPRALLAGAERLRCARGSCARPGNGWSARPAGRGTRAAARRSRRSRAPARSAPGPRAARRRRARASPRCRAPCPAGARGRRWRCAAAAATVSG